MKYLDIKCYINDKKEYTVMLTETHRPTDRMLNTLSKLQNDSRLTKDEQQDIKLAWGYLYYQDCVTRKLEALHKGDKTI